MSGIGGIIHWDGGPAEPEQIERMMGQIPHRGPDGVHSQVWANAGFGHALLAIEPADRRRKQPYWNPNINCGIVLDGSLYNRAELRANLSRCGWLGSDASDCELILAAYERWGTECTEQLDGDFAFAIWDARDQTLIVARDPFGAKPLFYVATRDRFAFGSEQKQLLALPGVERIPDDATVAGYLLAGFDRADRSFYRDIQQLQAAHVLVARQTKLAQQRYWNPDLNTELPERNIDDSLDQFRELFRASVKKRLATDGAVVAELSGGLDSSSVVGVAADIYRNSAGILPPFSTMSVVPKGLDCDDTDLIREVARDTSFEPRFVHTPANRSLLEGIGEQFRMTDTPMANFGCSPEKECADLLRAIGAKVLLTGHGGDEFAEADYYLRDLALRWEFGCLARDARRLGNGSSRAGLSLFLNASRVLVPPGLRSIWRGLRPTRANCDWLEPSFAAGYVENARNPSPSHQPRNLLTREALLLYLNYPRTEWELSAMEATATRNGCVVRHPFFDRSMAELALRLPLKSWEPLLGHKSLLRRSMAPYLPQRLLQRRRGTAYDSLLRQIMAKGRTELQEVLVNGRWHSEKYVLRQAAERLLHETDAHNAGAKVLFEIWRIITLELWLRDLADYDTGLGGSSEGRSWNTKHPITVQQAQVN